PAPARFPPAGPQLSLPRAPSLPLPHGPPLSRIAPDCSGKACVFPPHNGGLRRGNRLAIPPARPSSNRLTETIVAHPRQSSYGRTSRAPVAASIDTAPSHSLASPVPSDAPAPPGQKGSRASPT